MQSAAATELEQDNPLTAGLERVPVRDTALVIFGATGDLAHRKLLPAVDLAHEGALPERFELIGIARSRKPTSTSGDGPRSRSGGSPAAGPTRPCSKACFETCATPRIVRRSDTSTRALGSGSSVVRRARRRPAQPGFLSFHRAPLLPGDRGRLGEARLNEVDDAERRIVIEKPFGYDLASARALNAAGA